MPGKPNKGASVQHTTGAVTGFEVSVESPGEQTWPEAREAAGCILCGGPLEKQATDLFFTRFGLAGRYEARACPRCRFGQKFPGPSPAKLKGIYESHYQFVGTQ